MPVGEFFWTNFVRRCRREMDVGDDFDPYRHWDLDMVVLTANMDPRITGIEVLEDNDRAQAGQDRVRGHDRTAQHPSDAALRGVRIRIVGGGSRRSSSTTRTTRAATSSRSTTRSTASAMN